MVTECASARPRRSASTPQGPDAPVGVGEAGQTCDVHDVAVPQLVKTADDRRHGARVVRPDL